MTGAGQAALSLALAVAAHLAAFALGQPVVPPPVAGVAAPAQASLADTALAELVAEWDRPPEVAPAPASAPVNVPDPSPAGAAAPVAPATAPPPLVPETPVRPPVPAESPALPDVAPPASISLPAPAPRVPEPPPAPDAAPDAPPAPPVPGLRPKPRPDPRPEPAAKPAPKPAKPAKPAQPAATAPDPAKPPKPAKPAKVAAAAAKPGAAATGTGTGNAAKAAPSDKALVKTWGAAIRARVEARKAYPPAAKGATGTTTLSLTVSTAGRLLSVSVAKSSGNRALDAAAIKAAKSAGRFPAAPKGIGSGTHRFTLPLTFTR
jgi:protein TonB